MKFILPCLAILPLLCALAVAAAAVDPLPARSVPKKPTICAHRGASVKAPENTVAAFKLAGQLGADMFELDVSLTKDGEMVIMHDATVDRTTDGTGKVSDLTLAQIKTLDAGSWKGAQFTGERVPTLEDTFVNREGQMINIEIKANVPNVEETADKVVALIQRYGLQKNVVVSSFSAAALERVYADDPTIPTGFLFGATIPKSFPRGITAVHPYFSVVNEKFVGWARGNGWNINAWTINDPKEMRRLMSLGVDMIITDAPDTLKHLRDGA